MHELLGDRRNMWRMIWVILVVVLVGTIVVGIRYIIREEPELDWKDELVAVLRDYEVEWTAENVKEWESKKTYPVDYAILYAAYESGRFFPGNPVMKVGNETLYTDDFNAELYQNHFPDFSSNDEISDELMIAVAEKLRSDSVILQEGEDDGFVELEEEIFNSTEKDFLKRNSAVAELTDRYMMTTQSVVEGDCVNVWFHNVDEPEMGAEAAKEVAYQKISQIRERIVAGELTFVEASEQIIADKRLREFDAAIEVNALCWFSINGDEQEFNDPQMREQIEELAVGEVSQPLLGRDTSSTKEEIPDDEWYEAYYKVVKVTKKEDGADSYVDWLAEAVDVYRISVM